MALGTLDAQLMQGAATIDTEQQLQQLQAQLHTLDQQIIADFNDIGRHITEKQLSDSIQQRQQDAVATYQNAYNDLISQLNSITTETDIPRKQQSIQTLKATLASYQFKRSQQPFDPEQLPNRSLRNKGRNKGTQYLIMLSSVHGQISKSGITRVSASHHPARQPPSGCVFH